MEYTWSVRGVKKNADDKLVQIYWKKTGVDKDDYEGSYSGSTSVDPEVADINCDGNLTEEEVIAFIQTVVVGIYEDHVNARIQKRIDDQKVEYTDLPWDATPIEASEE